MKVPLVTADAALRESVAAVLRAFNRTGGRRKHLPVSDRMDPVTVGSVAEAIEYVNYQMPPLLLLNFSDPAVDAFAIMQRITEDAWLNHGSIIALYADAETFDRVSELQDTNIIIHLHHNEVPDQLATVLGIIRSHRQILFQRAIQTDLVAAVAGQFSLGPDIRLVPAYANLVANYLFNVGFVDRVGKLTVSLVLTEMLTNAIEHGNCEITAAEKRAWLETHGTVHGLIAERYREPRIRRRKVLFSYDIQRQGSRFVIRDQGKGFDWRRHLEAMELDPLALHGRGILLARESVDEIRYNKKGNEVTLSLRHEGGAANIPSVIRDNEVLTCAPGAVIFEQGEASDFLYYVAEGIYRVEVNGNHVANLTPDDMLMGEMSFLLEETRSATVTAQTHGRLIKISKEDFINIIKNQPYYGLFLSKLLATRLHRLSRGILS